jgi:arylsulfatase A-like enzyme
LTAFARSPVRAVVASVGAVFVACSADPPPAKTAASAVTGTPSSDTAGGPARGSDARSPASPRPHPAPPADCNVVVLSIDSLRTDMPWNGYARPIAPNLTEMESKAVSYTRAYAVSSYTSMSLGGLLAGRLPSELKRSGYFFGTYRDDAFFPQLLQKAHVHTMGVMAHFYFRGAGFEAGFDDWKIVPGVTYDANTDRDVTSPQSEKVAEQLLGDPANDSRRFFFWAHFLDPHDQYLRHQGIDWGAKARDLYDGEVTFTDRYVGKLYDFIEAQPWARRTVVIVTSDHGEEFGENGMWRHAFELWEPLVHVPLFFLAPGLPARRVDARRSAVDLAPTILELFGVTPDPRTDGTSLVHEIFDAPPAESRDVVVDLPATSDSGRRRALLTGDDEKVICSDDTRCKLYDLKEDPGEKSPVTSGPEYKAIKAHYDEVSRSIKEVAPYACAGECLNAANRKKGLAP